LNASFAAPVFVAVSTREGVPVEEAWAPVFRVLVLVVVVAVTAPATLVLKPSSTEAAGRVTVDVTVVIVVTGEPLWTPTPGAANRVTQTAEARAST
jgi:hypothetical protein